MAGGRGRQVPAPLATGMGHGRAAEGSGPAAAVTEDRRTRPASSPRSMNPINTGPPAKRLGASIAPCGRGCKNEDRERTQIWATASTGGRGERRGSNLCGRVWKGLQGVTLSGEAKPRLLVKGETGAPGSPCSHHVAKHRKNSTNPTRWSVRAQGHEGCGRSRHHPDICPVEIVIQPANR